MTVNESTKTLVRERAGLRCEYCQLRQDDSPLAVLHVEHVIPRKHGGTDDIENLALACIDCNLHKGPNLTGIDPDTEEITVLFHPRRDVWDDHFEWQGIQIVGKTPVGRTTVRVFEMNSDEQLGLRLS
ncbi:HNH endonuclease [Novipirellula sp. SH528]|uniref:HNH endonuclease n=1 Tax=Novipirellula sp. SH528 TaxID=3454466 RepID=UPI003F9FFCEF